jgi:hypothetical protein
MHGPRGLAGLAPAPARVDHCLVCCDDRWCQSVTRHEAKGKIGSAPSAPAQGRVAGSCPSYPAHPNEIGIVATRRPAFETSATRRWVPRSDGGRCARRVNQRHARVVSDAIAGIVTVRPSGKMGRIAASSVTAEVANHPAVGCLFPTSGGEEMRDLMGPGTPALPPHDHDRPAVALCNAAHPRPAGTRPGSPVDLFNKARGNDDHRHHAAPTTSSAVKGTPRSRANRSTAD